MTEMKIEIRKHQPMNRAATDLHIEVKNFITDLDIAKLANDSDDTINRMCVEVMR